MRALVVLLLLLWSGGARAVDYEVAVETVGQAYQLRAGDDTLVNRRRLTQYLGLDVYNLGPRDAHGLPHENNQFHLSLSLRFDAELGDYAQLAERSGRTATREPWGQHFDLLHAYVGGDRIGGFLDFRLGRVIFFDLYDIRALDGLWVEARAPFGLAVEAWGGAGVSGLSPFDSSVYRADGVALGGNTLGSLPARQETAIQPTFGIAVKTSGWRDVQARVSYLRTMSATEGRQPDEPGWGVVEERVGAQVQVRLLKGRLFPWGGFRWGLLAGRLEEGHLGLRAQVAPGHGLVAEYAHTAPTFDGDSIWNVFGSEAMNDVRVGYDFGWRRLSLYARGFLRRFGDHVTSARGSDPARADLAPGFGWGAVAGARLAAGRGFARLDLYYDDGYGGLKVGGQLTGRLGILGDWERGLSAEGRFSYVYFRHDLRADAESHSLGVQAGLRYAVVHGLVLHLVVEENVNRFAAGQFRLLALADLTFFLGPRARQRTRPLAWSGL